MTAIHGEHYILSKKIPKWRIRFYADRKSLSSDARPEKLNIIANPEILEQKDDECKNIVTVHSCQPFRWMKSAWQSFISYN